MLSFPPAHSQPREGSQSGGVCPPMALGAGEGPGSSRQGSMETGFTRFSLEAVVLPRHSEGPGDPLVMAKGTLQGRGTWAGGQHCLLKPDPGRNPHHGPWPHSSGRHHPLPHTTHREQSPTPPHLLPSPPNLTEDSATRTHFTDRASRREPAPGHAWDPPGQTEPAPFHHHTCLPLCGCPHRAPPCVQTRLSRLVFGETLFAYGGMCLLGSPGPPRQRQTGRCQCPGSTHRC